MRLNELSEEEAINLPDGENYLAVWEYEDTLWSDLLINYRGGQLVFCNQADEFVNWQHLPSGLDIEIFYFNRSEE